MGMALQAAEELTRALENHDLNSTRAWLADDFTFHDTIANFPPIPADTWLENMAGMFQAFPDLRYNFEIMEEDGESVWISNAFQGTHQGDWDLSNMGMGTVPASGRQVHTGRAVIRGTVNSAGQITRIEVVEGEEGYGIRGLMQQLGINPG